MFGVMFFVSGNTRKNTSIVVLGANQFLNTYTERIESRDYVAVPKDYINCED